MWSGQASAPPPAGDSGGGESAPASAKDAPFYCPGCGMRANYQKQCVGKPEAPHPPIEVVSTDELQGDPEKHTPAPDSVNLG